MEDLLRKRKVLRTTLCSSVHSGVNGIYPSKTQTLKIDLPPDYYLKVEEEELIQIATNINYFYIY